MAINFRKEGDDIQNQLVKVCKQINDLTGALIIEKKNSQRLETELQNYHQSQEVNQLRQESLNLWKRIYEL